jgi:hypothetical protein
MWGLVVTAILITGVPGSGKSSVAQELCRRGNTAIDADEDDALSGWVSTVKPGERPSEEISDWFTNHRWEWNSARLDRLIEWVGAKTIFLCGSASNLDELIDRFSMIIALEIDVETLADRLDVIDRAHGYAGGDGDTRAQIGGWLPRHQERLRGFGALSVDAKQSIEDIVSEILVVTGAGNIDSDTSRRSQSSGS